MVSWLHWFYLFIFWRHWVWTQYLTLADKVLSCEPLHQPLVLLLMVEKAWWRTAACLCWPGGRETEESRARLTKACTQWPTSITRNSSNNPVNYSLISLVPSWFSHLLMPPVGDQAFNTWMFREDTLYLTVTLLSHYYISNDLWFR
jgi:hypothetical protein